MSLWGDARREVCVNVSDLSVMSAVPIYRLLLLLLLVLIVCLFVFFLFIFGFGFGFIFLL